jgi:GTP-binding protein HflX
LERKLEELGKRREQRRARRRKTGVPILSIIGYTNAGKTTLFNLLTRSQFHVEEKLFATLDTATRRLRFPISHKVVVTDTVGLIKDLPKDLIGAFRPTFDELQESDLLIHLVDISNPYFHEHIEEVEKIFFELKLNYIPRLLVFNKEDKLSREEVETICEKYNGISISALQPGSLEKFLLAIDRKLWEERDSMEEIVKLTKEESFGISNENF